MARTQLTPEVVEKLEYYWQLATEITLSDEEICARIGIKYPTLKKALQRDQKVKRLDGTKDSLVSLRARARAGIVAGYLQRHVGLLLKAESSGDLKTAHAILCWLESRQFPQRFNVQPTSSDQGTKRTGIGEVPKPAADSPTWEKEQRQLEEQERLRKQQEAQPAPAPPPTLPTTT